MKKPKQSTVAYLFNSIAKELKLAKVEGKSLTLKNNFANACRLIDAMSKFYISPDHHSVESFSGTLIIGHKPDDLKSGVDPELAGLSILLKELSTQAHLFDKNSLSVRAFDDEVELVSYNAHYQTFVSYVAIDLSVNTRPFSKYEYVVYENPDIEGYFNIGIYVARNATGSKDITLIPANVVFGRSLDLEIGDLEEFIQLLSGHARAFKDRAVDTVKLRDLIQVEKVYCME